MAGVLKLFQDYVDNNQAAINSLDKYNPFRYAAQGVQDIANVVAHPVKTTKNAIKTGEQTMRQVVQNPKKSIPDMAMNAVSNNEYKDIEKDPKLYMAKKTGETLTDIMLTAASSGGAGKVGKGVGKGAKAVEKSATKVVPSGSTANTATKKGVEKVVPSGSKPNTPVKKSITKSTPLEYQTNTPVKKVTDFPETKPVLNNIEDMKVVKTPKAQPVKEDLTDINSLKKNPPSNVQPKADEQLYNMKDGDLRKAPSDVEQLYLEQYRKYPAEMFEANPTIGTNTRLMTDWAEGLVGKKGYSNALRGQIFRGLRRNSTHLPTMNMGYDVGKYFNRQVKEGMDPYWLYSQNPRFKSGSTVGFYEPFYDTINIANKRYAQAIYDYNGLKKSVGDIYPHEVTHKVIGNLEEELLKNPNNRKLSEKINEMRTLVGEPREALNRSEVLSNAFPAALNLKYQSEFAPFYGTGKLNDIQVLRNAEGWWRKEISPYALKREESLFKGPNLANPQSSPDMSLSDYMKILDDEQYLRRMKDL